MVCQVHHIWLLRNQVHCQVATTVHSFSRNPAPRLIPALLSDLPSTSPPEAAILERCRYVVPTISFLVRRSLCKRTGSDLYLGRYIFISTTTRQRWKRPQTSETILSSGPQAVMYFKNHLETPEWSPELYMGSKPTLLRAPDRPEAPSECFLRAPSALNQAYTHWEAPPWPSINCDVAIEQNETYCPPPCFFAPLAIAPRGC